MWASRTSVSRLQARLQAQRGTTPCATSRSKLRMSQAKAIHKPIDSPQQQRQHEQPAASKTADTRLLLNSILKSKSAADLKQVYNDNAASMTSAHLAAALLRLPEFQQEGQQAGDASGLPLVLLDRLRNHLPTLSPRLLAGICQTASSLGLAAAHPDWTQEAANVAAARLSSGAALPEADRQQLQAVQEALQLVLQQRQQQEQQQQQQQQQEIPLVSADDSAAALAEPFQTTAVSAAATAAAAAAGQHDDSEHRTVSDRQAATQPTGWAQPQDPQDAESEASGTASSPGPGEDSVLGIFDAIHGLAESASASTSAGSAWFGPAPASTKARNQSAQSAAAGQAAGAGQQPSGAAAGALSPEHQAEWDADGSAAIPAARGQGAEASVRTPEEPYVVQFAAQVEAVMAKDAASTEELERIYQEAEASLFRIQQAREGDDDRSGSPWAAGSSSSSSQWAGGQQQQEQEEVIDWDSLVMEASFSDVLGDSRLQPVVEELAKEEQAGAAGTQKLPEAGGRGPAAAAAAAPAAPSWPGPRNEQEALELLRAVATSSHASLPSEPSAVTAQCAAVLAAALEQQQQQQQQQAGTLPHADMLEVLELLPRVVLQYVDHATKYRSAAADGQLARLTLAAASLLALPDVLPEVPEAAVTCLLHAAVLLQLQPPAAVLQGIKQRCQKAAAAAVAAAEAAAAATARRGEAVQTTYAGDVLPPPQQQLCLHALGLPMSARELQLCCDWVISYQCNGSLSAAGITTEMADLESNSSSGSGSSWWDGAILVAIAQQVHSSMCAGAEQQRQQQQQQAAESGSSNRPGKSGAQAKRKQDAGPNRREQQQVLLQQQGLARCLLGAAMAQGRWQALPLPVLADAFTLGCQLVPSPASQQPKGKQHQEQQQQQEQQQGLSLVLPSPQEQQQALEALVPQLEKLDGSYLAELARCLGLPNACQCQLSQPWMAAFFQAAASPAAAGSGAVLADLSWQELLHVLRLAARGVRSGGGPVSLNLLAAAMQAATAQLQLPQSGEQQRQTDTALQILEVLELLLCGLRCPPSAKLVAAVAASQLVPVLSALKVKQLPMRRRASLARVLAWLRCRPRPQHLHQLLAPLQGKLASLEPAEVASLAWSLAELQMVPTAAMVAELLEVSGTAMAAATAAAAGSAASQQLQQQQGVLTAGALALLARSLVQLGIVPDSAWQQQYQEAARQLMPAASFEELSLLAYATLHFGQQPTSSWVHGLLQETHFKMAEADGSSLARLSHFISTMYEASMSAPAPKQGSRRPPPLPPLPSEWFQALIKQSLRVLDTYDPPDLLALQLRSVAGLRWLPPAGWLRQVLTALDVALPELSPTGHVVVLTAMTVLGTNWETASQVPDVPMEEGAQAPASIKSLSFINRVVLSAYKRRDEFDCVELAWLLEDCLPRLADDSVGDSSSEGGAYSSPGYQMPRSVEMSFAHTLARKQEEWERDGNNMMKPDAASCAAALGEYVSPTLLEQCLVL